MDGTDWIPASGRLRSFGMRISAGTVLFALGSVLIGMAAINADINLLMVLFGLCLGAGAIAAFSGWRALRSIEVQRQAPEVVFAGQPFEMRYTVRNLRSWGCARAIHVADAIAVGNIVSSPEAFIPIIRPHETIVAEVPMVSRTRGRVSLTAIGVATRFPFGLFTKYVAVPSSGELVVLPELGQLLKDVQAATRAASQGGGDGTPARHMGDEEYYGVREYRAGDNPRRIHWRRSARTGQLMVREMARSAARQLWVVLCTRVAPGSTEEAERLELAISCAATVIVDALERGIRVGLLCDGEPLVVMPPGGGRAHRPRLLRELAIRGENKTDDLSKHIERMLWPSAWRGPCVVFAANETEAVRTTAGALGRILGQATIYVPGTAAFNTLFAPARSERRRRVTVEPGRRATAEVA